jgi:hypothetical protein
VLNHWAHGSDRWKSNAPRKQKVALTRQSSRKSDWSMGVGPPPILTGTQDVADGRSIVQDLVAYPPGTQKKVTIRYEDLSGLGSLPGV